MLKYNDVNLLTVFGLRRMDHCPPHFTAVKFDSHTTSKHITDWIWENLEGRFYFGDVYFTAESGGVMMQKQAAFELAAEASYFSLILDTIDTPIY